MPNKRHSPVRKRTRTEPANDRRVIRTRQALGMALVELMMEQRFDEIRVEQVLQRAKVGRATFYSHFENKRDLLLADVNRMCDWLLVDFAERPSERRVAPVAELFSHVQEAKGLVEVIDREGLRNDVLDVITARLASTIEVRLAERKTTATASLSQAMMARMFAATLVEMLDWWMHNGAVPDAQEMDRQYHVIVGGGLDRVSPNR